MKILPAKGHSKNNSIDLLWRNALNGSMPTKKIQIPIIAILAALFLGCSTTGPNPIILYTIQGAVAGGTTIAMSERPEWRPQFQRAHDELKTLLDNGKLTMSQLQSVLVELPVKALSSETAKLIFSTAGLFLDNYLGQLTKLDQVAAIPKIGEAIKQGLADGLGRPITVGKPAVRRAGYEIR